VPGAVEEINGIRPVAQFPRIIAPAVAGIRKLPQGYFHNPGDFPPAHFKGVRIRYHPDERGNPEAGDGEDIVEPAQYVYVLGPQADLLLGFSQRRFERIFAAFTAPAGKGHFIPVSGHVARPQGEQKMPFAVLDEKRDQHGRGFQIFMVYAHRLPRIQPFLNLISGER